MKEVFSYKNIAFQTKRLANRFGVPKHWSKSKNEKFDVPTICVFFVFFCIEDKSYRRFAAFLFESKTMDLKEEPHWTTIEKAFKRLPPGLVRRLEQESGKCKHTLRSLDPTYFQTSNPSASYCARIGRDIRKYKGRKVSVVVCPRCDLVPNVFLRAKERHAMKDIPELLPSFIDKTVLGDKEFDAEHFHEQIARVGGHSFVPPKYQDVPIWRTKGEHRKRLKRKGLPKVYTLRAHSESNNHAVKTVFGHTLNGRTFWPQARNCYGKYLAYNLMLKDRMSRLILTFYRAGKKIKMEAKLPILLSL